MEDKTQIFKSFKISGYDIQVIYDNHILTERNNAGEYTHKTQTIRLASGLTKQMTSEVLMHEILEAIDSIYNLKLNHDGQLNILSIALHQIFSDYPEFLCIDPREGRN